MKISIQATAILSLISDISGNVNNNFFILNL